MLGYPLKRTAGGAIVPAACRRGRRAVRWCYPQWSGKTVPQQVAVAGKSYSVLDPANPFLAAPAERLVPRAARQVSATTVEVQYAGQSGRVSIGRWSLEPERQDVQFSLTVVPERDGLYSVGFSAFDDCLRSEAQFVLCRR